MVKELILSLQTRAQNGTLPHALLFEGSPSSLKEKFATELAHFLLKGVQTDLHHIQPDKTGHTMAAIRELIQEAYLPPYEADCKVFLLEDADALSEICQNALLKTLEEPPQNTYLFLICERAISLLPTLLSRCTLLHFTCEAQAPIDPSIDLFRKLLQERLKYGIGGWHDLLLEIDSIEEKNESALLEEVLIFARSLPTFPLVYEHVVSAKEALQSHIRFRHVFEALLLKMSNLALDS
jgi:DNA polymerase III delta prime subunit